MSEPWSPVRPNFSAGAFQITKTRKSNRTETFINPRQFREILRNHKRVAIVGGPGTGKTTLANQATDRPVHHNDDAKHLNWDQQPFHWIKTATEPSFVIEGVHAARAIRKGLQVDAVVHLTAPHIEQNKGQISMSKGQDTIMKDVIAQNPKLPIYR